MIMPDAARYRMPWDNSWRKACRPKMLRNFVLDASPTQLGTTQADDHWMNSPRLRTAYSPLFAWEDCTFVNQFVTRSGVGHPDDFFLEGACAGTKTPRLGCLQQALRWPLVSFLRIGTLWRHPSNFGARKRP